MSHLRTRFRHVAFVHSVWTKSLWVAPASLPNGQHGPIIEAVLHAVPVTPVVHQVPHEGTLLWTLLDAVTPKHVESAENNKGDISSRFSAKLQPILHFNSKTSKIVSTGGQGQKS